MKITLLQNNIPHSQGNLGLLSESQNFREKNGVCERGYSTGYCGSFTGKSEAAATVIKKGVWDKLLTSEKFNKFLKYAEEHNVSTSALIALVLAGIMRPIVTMALPGKKDKEDKIYASGHAMASGIMGFLVSTAVTSPLDGAISKCIEASEKAVYTNKLKEGETLESVNKMASKVFKDMFQKIKDIDDLAEKAVKLDLKEAKALRAKQEAMKTLVKNIPDWIIAVPRACLTIALIPPILKYVFGIEKKKKPQNVEQVAEQKVEAPQMNFIDKPTFESFKGGVK